MLGVWPSPSSFAHEDASDTARDDTRTRSASGRLRSDSLPQVALCAYCDRLPELQKLKQRLQADSGGVFDAVFMTGSGSTIVCVGSHGVCQLLEHSSRSGDLDPCQTRVMKAGSMQDHVSHLGPARCSGIL